MTMRAYNNDLIFRDQVIAGVRQHQEMDHLRKGGYDDEEDGHFVGCAVGCTLETVSRLRGENIAFSDHSAYATRLGIPEILAYLEDRIFENLPDGLHLDWPTRFLEAIACGADLSLVWPKFAHWLLVDPQNGALGFAKSQDVRATIERVADLYHRLIQGENVSYQEWQSTAAAAEAAWASAAWAAKAASAAAAVAWAAKAASAAAAVAWAAKAILGKWRCMADKLIELLQECKP